MNVLAQLANRMDNAAGERLAHLLCHRFRVHTLHCRGRADHTRGGELVSGRWLQ